MQAAFVRSPPLFRKAIHFRKSRFIPVRIDIDNAKRPHPGRDADIRVWPTPPPFFYFRRVGSRLVESAWNDGLLAQNLLGIENVHKVGSIGKAGYGWETRIVDDKGVDVTPGLVGELLVKGPGVMREMMCC